MMVPSMVLDLILTEERISLIICEAPISSAQLLMCVEHGSVERVLLTSGDVSSEYWRQVNATHLVANHGHKPADSTTPKCNIILSAQDRHIAENECRPEPSSTPIPQGRHFFLHDHP